MTVLDFPTLEVWKLSCRGLYSKVVCLSADMSVTHRSGLELNPQLLDSKSDV